LVALRLIHWRRPDPFSVDQRRAGIVNGAEKPGDVAREIRAGNVKVIEAPTLSTARGIINRQAARRDASIDHGAEKAAREILGEEEPAPSVINTDFCEWAKTYTGDKFKRADSILAPGARLRDFALGAQFRTPTRNALRRLDLINPEWPHGVLCLLASGRGSVRRHGLPIKPRAHLLSRLEGGNSFLCDFDGNTSFRIAPLTWSSEFS
jgi:hypothetical protein